MPENDGGTPAYREPAEAFRLASLRHRADLVERMDEADCCEQTLLRTLRQFSSINKRLARYRMVLKKWVLQDMLRDPGRAYHLLDMGAGACDIACWLLDAATQLGLTLRITACERDARIVRHARSACRGRPQLEIKEQDVLLEPPETPVDYVFGNHFLHHLSDEQITALMQLWSPHVRRRMVFSDLSRSRAAYLTFSLYARIYPNSFIREDGLISIRRGFRKDELEAQLARDLPSGRPRVHRVFPGRIAVVIDGYPLQDLASKN